MRCNRVLRTVVLASLLLALCAPAAAVTANLKWNLQPTITVSGSGRSYNAATKVLTLCVGDSAKFSWSGSLAHDVASVSAANLASCNTAGAKTLTPVAASGTKVIKYSAAGLQNYVCTVGSHCLSMKVKIRVRKC